MQPGLAVPSKRPCGVEGEPGQAAAPKPRPPTAGATARSTSGGSGATGPTHPTLAAATVGGKAVVVEVRAPLQLAALVDPALQREALTVPVVSPAVVFQAALKVADQRVGPARARAAQAQRRGPTGAESGKAWPGTKAKATAKALAKAKAQAAMPGMHISPIGVRALAALGMLMEPLDEPTAAGPMFAAQCAHASLSIESPNGQCYSLSASPKSRSKFIDWQAAQAAGSW